MGLGGTEVDGLARVCDSEVSIIVIIHSSDGWLVHGEACRSRGCLEVHWTRRSRRIRMGYVCDLADCMTGSGASASY